MDRILEWDPDRGRIVVEPGVTLGRLLQKVLPDGWAPSACVGGLGLTMGGALSNNVHGKDAWRVGNFGRQVVSARLMSGDGSLRRVDSAGDPELWNALPGSMGLLGIVTEMTLELRRIPSVYVESRAKPVGSLEEMLDSMERLREEADFVVSWADAFARGPALGRGSVEWARWIEAEKRPDPETLRRSLEDSEKIYGLVPAEPCWALLRPFSGSRMVRWGNRVRYHALRAAGPSRAALLFSDFNFIHKRIPNLKHIYRPEGLLEPQPLMPRDRARETIAWIFRLCQREGMESLLCGIKMHRGDDHPLSYAGDGFSFGIDIAMRGRDRGEVDAFSRRLYEFVAEAGGKTFLAKDEILPRDLFGAMYPGHAGFLAVKRRADPEGIFSSDMYRRLLA